MSGGSNMYKVICCFLFREGLDSVLLAEGSILDPCYVMWDVTLLVFVRRALPDYLCCWYSVYKIC